MKYRIIGIILGLIVIATSHRAIAQSPGDLKDYSHIYDVKAICGPNKKGDIIAPGHYWTAINILNSSRDSVKVSAWVSVGLPGLQPGLTNGTADGGLEPGQTMEVDCPTIRRLADSERVKGYL